MAMTLRLTDAEAEVLRRRAEMERRPMQAVVRQAIREYVESHTARNCWTRSSMRNCPVTPKR
jgi:predicted transcriptional regulator